LSVFGLATTAGIYAAFFVGIYDFRATELINMRRVPMIVKLTASSLIAAKMTYLLWEKQIYEPELYRVALKYRPQFDQDYMKKINGEKEQTD
jgi:hypothetical protein